MSSVIIRLNSLALRFFLFPVAEEPAEQGATQDSPLDRGWLCPSPAPGWQLFRLSQWMSTAGPAASTADAGRSQDEELQLLYCNFSCCCDGESQVALQVPPVSQSYADQM